ncbi:hypothetical protein J4Q44_G00182840 [Coregonus suidteri]|uniref:Uncharacterized protein n=1 Tax=Coregonus suidteri TaxID=861788 RepID=A0AAN8QQJ8_9TELE
MDHRPEHPDNVTEPKDRFRQNKDLLLSKHVSFSSQDVAVDGHGTTGRPTDSLAFSCSLGTPSPDTALAPGRTPHWRMDGRDFGPPRSVHVPPSLLAMETHRLGAPAAAGRIPPSPGHLGTGHPANLHVGKFLPSVMNLHPHHSTHHGPTLWAGTNSGSVYAYALEVPGVGSGSGSGSGRGRGGAGGEGSVCVEAVLGKEIQLMHRAPVVSICVLDGRGKPLPEPYQASLDLATAPDMTNPHSVLIASEEQLKVFSLPKVSVNRCSVFLSPGGLGIVRTTGLCLSPGETCTGVNIPALRPQVRYDCIRKEDISGIASCVFTKNGQGLYLISPSEYQRFSLSAKVITGPLCAVEVERPPEPLSSDDTATPLRANGTHRNQAAEGLTEDPQCGLSSPPPISPLDSPLSMADLSLDTTGDLTVEDVRDFLT